MDGWVDGVGGSQLCRWLLRVLEDNGNKGVDLIVAMISQEVARASQAGTLFRANSIAAKLFGVYIKMAALRYLWHTLVLSVHSLNDAAVEASVDDGESSEPPPLRSLSLSLA